MKLGQHIGTQTAIGHAKQATRLAGEGLVAPRIQAGLATGDPQAIASLDAIVRAMCCATASCASSCGPPTGGSCIRTSVT